ncbi:uncharacterized protein F4822DRAFT_435444 [Hypoxylon trugodes]|uniref:uncharacterized protein n=1 Tax=Hypoxylon trugodes TaxID=326681 RepID=UPI0021952A9E|nr:uncharacterized protein F4822DRAFT_435444 [Hypoxylon trugodes]KAI1382576.1 hypothetical protein F4822DRAFT_435444 [Hypoxylon trugodes]
MDSARTTVLSKSSDNFSFDILAHRFDHHQATGRHHQTIERITTENILLYSLIAVYQKNQSKSANILKQAERELAKMEKAIQHYGDEKVAAEQDWLAFWGIEKVPVTPNGWI